MGSFKEDTYQELVPEDVDKSQEEWDNLSYHTQYYYAKEGRKEQMSDALNERRKEKRRYVSDYKQDIGCEVCGEDHRATLVLHHTEDKDDCVSNMVNDDASIERINEEISKCAVLCANCHRKYHYDSTGHDKIMSDRKI